ncbi:MAG: fructosamine kinase family protein [Gallionella sp.]|nr:fructosamine kinase family protein [Gallionella sp.]
MTDWAAISAAIGSATRQPFQLIEHDATGGGCINQTWRIRGQDGRRFFVKFNAVNILAMFVAEAAGLNEIAATNTIRVPQPVAYGNTNTHSFLVLEYLALSSRGNAALLGEQLAKLHLFSNSTNSITTTSPLPCRERARERVGCGHPHFGFAQDNFIGTTPQSNAWTDDWVTFWREQRLGFQLRLAERNGYGGKLQTLGEKLLDALPAFFSGYSPQPALLHGDLWSGNHAFLADGTPVIFDPAPYFGDRECDLAMTELFGGYPADFYAAYRAAYPLDAGYATRRDLYNLYHILNHTNLFGGGYARQAEGVMQRLLAGVAG